MKKIKECKKHGLVEHNEQGKGKNKRTRCSKCAVDAVKKRRLELKHKSIEYKGGACINCGYDKCIAALEFHHTESEKKDFGISANGYTRSWEKVKKELDKCILVCSNCHREIHYQINAAIM